MRQVVVMGNEEIIAKFSHKKRMQSDKIGATRHFAADAKRYVYL